VKNPTSKITTITTIHMMIIVTILMFTVLDASIDTTIQNPYTQLRPTYIKKSLYILEKSLAFVALWDNWMQ
jgi:hypothetical protein